MIMTAVARGPGMRSLALGWGANLRFRSPMAIAVISGLITSFLLAAPALFTYIDALAHLIKRSINWLRR
mgnify:FL=1